MSVWRPCLFDDVSTDVPLDLTVTQETQPAAASTSYPRYPGYPTYPSSPGYLPLPVCEFYGPARTSPGGSSGYQSAAAPSPSPQLAPPAAVSLESSTVDLEDAEMSDDPDFQLFERAAMEAMAVRNGGALVGNNPRMRRTVRSQAHAGAAAADASYRRTRQKNNAAAKQSRDRRKLREIHLSLKVTYLKRQVTTLKAMLRSRACNRCRSTLS